MFVNHLILAVFGLLSGAAVSAGTFAFMIVIGVVPRMIAKCNRAADTICFENAIILGGILGNILAVFPMLRIPFGVLFLCIYGLSAGIFVGCIAVALAEILNTFPIIFHRFGQKEGLNWIMLFMALGKMCGAFYYFFREISVG